MNETARIPDAEHLRRRLILASRGERRPGDEFGQGGWQRPTLVAPPAASKREARWAPYVALLIVAVVLTIAVLAAGGHI